MTRTTHSSKPPKKVARPSKSPAPVIETPKRVYRDSRINRMAELLVGETICAGVRVEIDRADSDTLKQTSQSLKSSMSKAADQASRRTSGKFITEVGDFRTRSGDIIMVAAVTRLE